MLKTKSNGFQKLTEAMNPPIVAPTNIPAPLRKFIYELQRTIFSLETLLYKKFEEAKLNPPNAKPAEISIKAIQEINKKKLFIKLEKI